jgi:hypothetical protein
MVPEHDKERIFIEGVNDAFQDVVHLLLLCQHRWVVGTYAMPDMVDAKKVADEEIPRVSMG